MRPLRPPLPAPELEGRAADVLAYLSEQGASFFAAIHQGTGQGFPQETADALWDLVWAGHVTNDTFGPVRSFVSRRKSGGAGRRALSSRFPAHAQGRWSLTRSLISAQPDPTERHAAWANLLLERHGVVTRNTVLAESLPGGFSGIYPVYRHLKETGRIRRCYFVEGLGGPQFALPGAVDRRRSETKSVLVVLPATDPANTYGGVLAWPEIPDVRLARDAGAYVLLADGALVGYLDKGRRGLTLLDPSADIYGEVSRAMAEVAARHRRLTLLTVNNEPAAVSPLAAPLSEWGFATAPRGLPYRG